MTKLPLLRVYYTILYYVIIFILYYIIQGVQLKSGLYFNMSNLFTKIYNMLYYATNLYLQ